MDSVQKDERNRALARIKEGNRSYVRAEKSLIEAIGKQIEDARDEYFAALPRVPMGNCPICGETLVRMFDPFGLDGPWWRYMSPEREPAVCSHFYLLAGAVNFNKQPVPRLEMAAITGPSAPFVIRSELEPDGRSAVICQHEMEMGYRAYSIAYFSNPPKRSGRFAAQWHEQFDHQRDERTQRVRQRPILVRGNWDRKLLPWIERKKLFWCDRDSGNTELSVKPATDCPFLKLEPYRLRFTQVGYHGVDETVYDEPVDFTGAKSIDDVLVRGADGSPDIPETLKQLSQCPRPQAEGLLEMLQEKYPEVFHGVVLPEFSAP